MIDAVGIEAAGAALAPMHLVSLLQQQLREGGVVLVGDAGDQRGFGSRHILARDTIQRQSKPIPTRITRLDTSSQQSPQWNALSASQDLVQFWWD